jgi:PDZ domain-containing protein
VLLPLSVRTAVAPAGRALTVPTLDAPPRGPVPAFALGAPVRRVGDDGAVTFDPDILAPPEPDLDPAPPVTRRTVTLTVAVLATAVLAAVALVMPTAYAVRTPGPTEDTLGVQELGDGESAREVPLVEIAGAETYDASGQLRLTTVSVYGGPGGDVLLGDVLLGWVARDRSVQPVEAIFPPDMTREEQEETGQAEMVSSQENATVAALTELGHEVPATLTIVGAAPGTGADGVVAEGDVVRSIDGQDVVTHQDLLGSLDVVTPGDDVVLGVLRDGEPVDLTIATGEAGGRALLGVYLDPEYEYPVDVRIQIEDVGGPSAGTMFALAIIDKLTPEDELAGEVVAGTGTVDVEGNIGAIGGIEQKMFGAVRDGARWFLAPQGNCRDVTGHVPDGLRVVAVSTLSDARDAIDAIGAGRGPSLPTCS